jgi:long-subunit fatty acid transport protein
MSLGGAFTAVEDDINSLPFNPAGISFLRTNEVTFTYANYFEDINYGYSAFAHPLSKGGVIGLSATILDSGEINQTQEDSLGNFSSQKGQFQTRDFAAALSYGVNFNEQIGVGFSVRQINQKVENSSVSGWSVDGGTLWKSPINGLNVGAAITNLGASIDGHKLPTAVALGVVYKPIKLFSFNSDLVKSFENEISYREGIELSPVDCLAIRGGYKSDSDIGNNFYVGMGLNLRMARLDYAFAQSNDFSNTHRISFSLKFP